MKYVRMGSTGLTVSKTAIGTVPLQRLDVADAVKLMRNAYDAGITFFDSADNYVGSEAKLGIALAGVRSEVVISTKASTQKGNAVMAHIEKSLQDLKTDYIDIIQMHNPKILPDANDPDGAYAALVSARQKGYVRHIGFTSHDLQMAIRAAESGLFETVQYPLNYLSGEKDEELIRLCDQKGIGLIAMKPFAGGMIRNPTLTFMYFRSHENVVPIYGIQRQSELDILIELEEHTPAFDVNLRQLTEKGKAEFQSLFCRGCDRCLENCPQGIRPGYMGRIGDFLYRNPPYKYLTMEWYQQVLKIPSCIACGECVKSCPFGVDLRSRMKECYDVYMDLWSHKEDFGVNL